MSQIAEEIPQGPPQGHARVVYLGPVAPHWEVHSDFGDRAVIDAFRDRVMARLVLVPPHDPQFRRNRERVVRDAERERLLLEWDLGVPEEEGGLTTIGVDLGATKILAAVVDDGGVGAQRKRPTPDGGPEAVAGAIAALVEELGGADRLGVGTPGQVAGDRGVVVGSPNLAGWERPVPLGDLLRAGTGLERVAVGNDVNVATLAEQVAGAGRGHPDLLCVFLGTGVGGGLVLDGTLRTGARGLTGEIGHTTVHPGGRRCGCGLDGHTEAYAGRVAMEAEARRRHAAGEPTALVELAGDRKMKSGVFAKALAAADPVATSLLDEAVEAVSVAVASAVMLLDLDLVVLGGGVAEKLGPAFVDRIADAVRDRLFAGSSLEVVPAALGDHAGVVGAALLADTTG